MSRQPYPSDLTDADWSILAPLLPTPKPGGRPRTVNLREVINALRYLLREGCRWRAIPHDFGVPWQTVFTYFRQWRLDGTWKRVHDTLRKRVRQQAGRNWTPSALVLDSQSVKTGQKGGLRGYDAGKGIKGRKRHILVDTLGLIWALVVHPANIQDHTGAYQVLRQVKRRWLPRVKRIWADGIYKGKFVTWVQHQFCWLVEIVQKREKATTFEVLPHRWIVERTFAWFDHFRRLSKDYEFHPETSEAMIYLAMSHLMLKRLARA